MAKKKTKKQLAAEKRLRAASKKKAAPPPSAKAARPGDDSPGDSKAKTPEPTGGSSKNSGTAKKANPPKKTGPKVSAGTQNRILMGVGALAILGLFAWAILGSRTESGVTSAADWDLPAVANDPDGDGRITLAEFRGTPVVVNLYANWCSACDDELPAFQAVSDDLRGQVQFVGVHTQEDGGELDLPDKHDTNWWPIARDINGTRGGGSGFYDAVARTPGMPVTAFYDAQGNLVNVTSVLSESTLRAEIQRSFGITGQS